MADFVVEHRIETVKVIKPGLSLTPAKTEAKLTKTTFHHNAKLLQKWGLHQRLDPRQWAECSGPEGFIGNAE